MIEGGGGGGGGYKHVEVIVSLICLLDERTSELMKY